MTGRHRDGQPYASVYQRVWDGPARAEAERLDQVWSDWTVLYSLGKRSFYAVASWDGPQLVVVEDATSEGLEGRMQEAEMTRLVQVAPPSLAPRDNRERPPTGPSDRGPARRRRSPGGRTA
ncbi:hypothetical protein [Streptosporangium saharense]|uniref:Uncharacterized protein n=1 Tax=Streptosporangium saharense TaxID=1706840 RepID=A0A7W7QVS1_9ACTN|nr:hypothetical protein [Streptosporangium saharense]MBB4920600.1 hypothetical protein [Streptosporangium saharense]